MMEVVNMDTPGGDLVYWTYFRYEKWNMHLAATARGLCYVGSCDESIEALARWVQRSYPAYSLVQNDALMMPYAQQLTEYFQGNRAEFTLPVDLCGTPFRQTVWAALQGIALGQTYSYSHIAETIGRPDAVRAVGAAIGANPLLIVVPCHRVVGKNGTLTGYRGGLEAKAGLLLLEGSYSPSVIPNL
jgi:methylated-DNA-[protein]-cysteine S-methyltransferase